MKRATAIEIENTIALQAEGQADAIALMGMDLPDASEAPEWVHLLPVGPEVNTFDNRGPFRLEDASAVVTASIAAMGERRLPIDENHSTDLAAPLGMPAPARGWFVGFEARPDGIWGKVDWTPSGKALMADRAYGGISPVITLDARRRVLKITRASLINKPNLKGLTALHGENDMDLLAQLAKKLGLKDGASETAVLTAVDALGGQVTSLNGQLKSIVTAAGAAEDATFEVVLGAVTDLAKRPVAGKTNEANEALQAELNTAVTRINELETSGKKLAAETYVDGEIKRGRSGVKARREEFITLHMEDATKTEHLINGFPIFGASHTSKIPPSEQTAESLNAEEAQVAALLGLPSKTFAESRAKLGLTETAA